jgi:hypothetical protein
MQPLCEPHALLLLKFFSVLIRQSLYKTLRGVHVLVDCRANGPKCPTILLALVQSTCSLKKF